MTPINQFQSSAHERASHILLLREKAREKSLDTTEAYIRSTAQLFARILDKTEIEGITEEWHRQAILFLTMADIALCAAHSLLGGDTTPEQLADTITDTYRRKNADYGDSFARSLHIFGIVAAHVRISDKVNRLESIVARHQQAQVKDETILDTLLDLASYAIMAEMWITEPINPIHPIHPRKSSKSSKSSPSRTSRKNNS